ncbi:5-formyltetrahydrofolate cyclo-ligase [Lysobacter niastensis]|uniref:5-formyltetrahydrofolate cyclo-ligase n=1 Tax=Lysobacter niastensis TaxID=380629 RepID=A0ABS0B1P6_9GAMM|nr:5-formyltetrahydrofolate cyclo-ligase [Lysobacter niastensis]MBF6022400.1 5-formyltetrahydrofolate cyclo-ligase [Lysobacter niastensis]
MTADRAALRRELRDRRRALPPGERIAGAERLAQRLLALPFAPTSGYVAGYWAMDGEIALHMWQLRLPDECVYCLPVLHEDGHLRFAPWRPGDPLVSNRHGIPEPDLSPDSLLDASQMSLVVVPLVGFDRSCHRLGMGGGWYDRTFAFRQRDAAPPWLAGAAFDVQRIDSLLRADWDVALDAICTDSATYNGTPAI